VKKILFSMLVVLVSIALVLPAAVLADDVIADADGMTPINNNVNIAFGNIPLGSSASQNVLLAIKRQGNENSQPTTVFNNSASITVSVNSTSGTGSGAVFTSMTDSSIVLPANWVASTPNTLSIDTANCTVTVNTTGLTVGTTYLAKVEFKAEGSSCQAGTNLTAYDTINVHWTVVAGAGPEETADVIFDQTGVGTDFTGTVVTINGTAYNVTQLPVTITQGVGLNISFAYSSPLGVDGKQYVWTNTTGGLTTDQSGNITVPSGGGNVTGNYKTQYYLTLVTDPPGLTTPSGEGWYDDGSNATITTTSPVVSSPYTYFFAGWTTDDQDEIAEQYALNTTVLMDKAKTVTANYQAMTAGTGGKTLGFWSNKNGQSYIGSGDLLMLRNLNLRNKNGSAFDPANYNALKTWLLKADATYMPYMLSAQLAATELSVYNSLLSGSQAVWVDDGDGIFEPGESQSINSIMTAANNELGSLTTREYQEYLKDLLDDINNNLLWFVV
jgi:hypothetical protein